jgi:hypothetical protein
MVLLPRLNLLPARLSTAAAPPATEVSVALPREVLPRVKFTVPAGNVEPLAALTVAVIVVVAVWPRLEGLAAAEVAVATAGTVTVTVPEAVEPLNLASPP